LLLSFSSGFASAGQLVISLGAFEYSYSPLESNINKRTLQGFSTQAEEKMDKCENCPYVTYEKFEQYYGAFDYSDAWVTAAFEGRATSFANGNVDFSGFGYPGRTGMCLQSLILLPMSADVGSHNRVLDTLQRLSRRDRRIWACGCT
jgi:hypothetical protein